jgi:hypothetical protein
MREKVFKCCLCGESFIGYGNNPYPVDKDPEHRCCDVCNVTKVLPARVLELKNKIISNE